MSYYHRLFRPAPFKVRPAIPQHILLLGANGNSPAMMWAGPTDCQYCPLSSEVSLYAGYIWFASPPLGHTSGLQASAGCAQAFPSGLPPPHPPFPKRSWRERERESRLAGVDITERKSSMEWANHGIGSAPVWSDSFPDLQLNIGWSSHLTQSSFLIPQ